MREILQVKTGQYNSPMGTLTVGQSGTVYYIEFKPTGHVTSVRYCFDSKGIFSAFETSTGQKIVDAPTQISLSIICCEHIVPGYSGVCIETLVEEGQAVVCPECWGKKLTKQCVYPFELWQHLLPTLRF